MKKPVPFVKILNRLFILSVFLFIANALSAQKLVFKNPTLKSGNDLKLGAIYLFKNVIPGVNATVSIDQLVNGATVKKIDDNSGGLGFADAFQPEVQIGGKGESYALFTVRFINAVTGDPELMKSVQATSLDIDGNLTLKEFADINMSGGKAIYMGGTLEILLKSLPIIGSLFNQFRADNILGIEKDGIDTTAKGNMYTVTNSGINSFSVKYGAKSISSSNSSRQYSLYMQGFQYPNQVSLPLKLVSFTATLINNKTDIKWTTSMEENVSHFELERSYDGKNFNSIASVFAYGNSTSDKNYEYKDAAAASNSQMTYYRLRCVDNDGKFTYSQIRIIKHTNTAKSIEVQTYPNPFTSEIRITMPVEWQAKQCRIEFFNAAGQQVKAKTVSAASQTETITTDDLQRGIYIVKVSNQQETMQQKLLKN